MLCDASTHVLKTLLTWIYQAVSPLMILWVDITIQMQSQGTQIAFCWVTVLLLWGFSSACWLCAFHCLLMVLWRSRVGMSLFPRSHNWVSKYFAEGRFLGREVSDRNHFASFKSVPVFLRDKAAWDEKKIYIYMSQGEMLFCLFPYNLQSGCQSGDPVSSFWKAHAVPEGCSPGPQSP